MTRDQILRQLQNLFRSYLGVSRSVARGLVPSSVPAGKLYEAHVLSRVVERLVLDEKYSLILVGGNKIRLKSSPGPINNRYPHIELRRSGNCVAELWTDIEFLALSYLLRGMGTVTKGDYHELDLVVVTAGATGRPLSGAVWLGVECKNTGYEKSLLKEVLGIRRELSLLKEPRPTNFLFWPRATVPAEPPSCLVVYSTDANVGSYAAAGGTFGIDFVYEPM